ncbi:helix-turn-helix domain-containing protein [Gelidibacter maritimus]|uniref:Helix-turn-helix domain-containing protein n=1 Tax=Gelidibacter maritimus TaxID=2761487 RepID=A0A7W2M8A2_9FLAO|nr:helix-turn-helix domain-containing protein [Gelidibacter maritimus]MBA6154503.1 helix-turn-helix domain-containing protein [Gelidibacter maritimus]
METNKDIELAWNFVNSTNQSVFLTGKAGTGKTTFLHNLKHNSLKRIVVVAPTGVAAINAKGVTIHSFFQLPFGPILPDADINRSSGFNRKFSKTKIDIIKSMDLLIIDEISMVRADVLDGIDKTLKRFRDRNKTFGGVQVLMIGDLQQLSPVIRENEWQLLKQYYQTGYFFSSLAYQSCNAITIELKHIYRQENPKFIEILNEIRNNSLSQASADELNKRYIKNIKPDPKEGYIALTTHNNRAEQVNTKELDALTTKVYTYRAKVSGKFPDHAFPNKEELHLKVGAQVMFIKNDSSPEKRYFNGKIGKVIFLDKTEVVVKCPDDDYNINTTPEEWENITYSVNAETKAITEDKIGSFSQIPLRLAWAITIHKSQGLTFEKAIVDAQGAFAHGQTYVALSRCKSLEGLVLKSKIDSSQIINDQQVSSFTQSSAENQPDEEALELAKKTFQLDSINDIFNYYGFLYPINRLLDIFYKNRGSIQGHVEAPLISLKDGVTNLLKVGHRFNNQLQDISNDEHLPETNNQIQERFKKAIAYFKTETEKCIVENLKALSYSTDNKAIENDLIKSLDTIEELLATKLSYFNGLSEGFSTQKFLELRAKAVFLTKDKPKKSRTSVIEGTVNVELFELLRELRNEIANENDLIRYQVFTQKSLYELCEVLPVTKKQLLEINGFGKVRVEKYGTQILEVIKAYCEENAIETDDSIDLEKTPAPMKPLKKGESAKISLELFQSGKSISEIATERELVESTVFGHLSKFVDSGEVKVTDLISEAHFKELTELIPKHKFENLSDLKRQLDDKYSYNDIRLVLNSISE